MTPFDLVFLVSFLAAAVALGIAAVAAITGRRPRALRLLRRVGLGAGLYVAGLVVISLLSHGHEVGIGQEQCSDDWCVSVTGSDRAHEEGADRITVGFRLASHAGRISQRERYVVVYLTDRAGRRYDPGPPDGEIPFDTMLGPLEAKMTNRTFLVPAAASGLGVVIAREGAGRFPGCCVIGDEGSLLHERSVVRLTAPTPTTSDILRR